MVFSAEEIPDGDTRFKCAPPIRSQQNNEQLWEALRDGTLDFIASDHSPAPPELKQIASGNFKLAWGGIAGLQFSLPVIWSEAIKRGFSELDLHRWLSLNPSEFAGLSARKGKIQVGFDADLVVWNPDAEFEIETSHIFHRHKITPYAGRKVKGRTECTLLAGRVVFQSGKCTSKNDGELLLSVNKKS